MAGGTNTYAYADNNPIRFIDPTGTVAWEGSVFGVAALTWGTFTFDLKSECIDGKRGIATVLLTGPGIGVELTNFSFSSSDVDLEDSLDFINPMVFNDGSLDGGFIAAAGAALGPTPQGQLGLLLGGAAPNSPSGFGCAAIGLGNAGGTGCGGSRGFELGAGAFVGSSTVLSSRIENCSCSN